MSQLRQLIAAAARRAHRDAGRRGRAGSRGRAWRAPAARAVLDCRPLRADARAVPAPLHRRGVVIMAASCDARAFVVRSDDVAAQPWRNGGGATRELLARPAGDAWRVRVSVAEVAADGPFSSFPGVTRWFAVLEGRGVELTVDGRRASLHGERRRRSPSPARPTTICRLLDGPTRDLNLMLRGGSGALVRVVGQRDVAAARRASAACTRRRTGRAASSRRRSLTTTSRRFPRMRCAGGRTRPPAWPSTAAAGGSTSTASGRNGIDGAASVP